MHEKAADVLARWRDAERRASAAEPGTPERAAAQAEAEQARGEYQALVAEREAEAVELASLRVTPSEANGDA